MWYSRRFLRTAGLLATVFIAASCGTGDTETPEVDTSALQPGNYRTVPRSTEEVRTPLNIAILEAVRLGRTMPAVSEVDPRLVFVHHTYAGGYYTAEHPPTEYHEGVGIANFSTVVPGLVAGWSVNGQRREQPSLGRNASITLLRFTDAARAQHAAQVLSTNPRNELVRAIEIPGHPEARGHVTEYDSVMAWTPHAEYLIYTYVGMGVDIPPDQRPLAELTTRLLDAQLGNLRGYTPTPLSELAELPVDVDGMLARTLPPTDEGTAEAVITSAMARQLVGRTDRTGPAFDDAGVDLVVRAEPWIYRAEDAAAAQRLQAHFVSSLDPEYRVVESPPGMPMAHCAEHSEQTASFQCLFTNDRYTVVFSGQQLQELHQKVAAQYLLLDTAS
ncbi:DUF7373 family lipoprotein [Nocardia sp. X0981]